MPERVEIELHRLERSPVDPLLAFERIHLDPTSVDELPKLE
jgi:hypothetical protein